MRSLLEIFWAVVRRMVTLILPCLLQATCIGLMFAAFSAARAGSVPSEYAPVCGALATSLRTKMIRFWWRKKLRSEVNIQSFLHGLEPDTAVLEVRSYLGILVPAVLYTAWYGLLTLDQTDFRTIRRRVVANGFYSFHNLCQVHNDFFHNITAHRHSFLLRTRIL